MTSLHEPAPGLDRLPPDQRAVLQMVLGRGHSYNDIAGLLSIDRAAVRQRALAALDALGPSTRVPPPRRALITDYLLGQLPPRVSEEVRTHLAASAGERAWARVVASELAPVSPGGLPEIPSGAVDTERAKDIAVSSTQAPRDSEDGFGTAKPPPREVSRLGGAILLGAVAAAVIAAILIFVVFGGGGGTTHKAHKATVSKPTAAKPSTTARPLAQINLSSPTKKSKAVGIAEIIKAGSAIGVVVVAQGLRPNLGGDAYAIWLYKSTTSAFRLGYVKPGVTSNGRLETAGRLPTDAGSFKRIVVALQKGPSNKVGRIVLAGKLSGI